MKHRFLLYLMKQSFVLSGLSLVALLSLTACAPGEGADPGVQDFSIAYVKRTIPVDNNGDPEQADVREPLLFSEGGDLFLRESSAVTSAETNLTLSVTNGVGDVKDVETSFDGKKILFSLRLQDPDPNDDTVPSWNIYEYDRDNQQLRRIITSDLTAEEGDDIAPHYLPGNRIVFSSNRQKQAKAVLLDEDLGKEQFSSLDERRRVKALVLHVMNDDGTDIHQISFNQSHDLDPTVLSDGRILFSRWDNMGNRNAINLYTTSPDGSDIQLYYGGHGDSHDIEDDGVTVQFTQPHEMADGRIMSLMRPFTDTYGGGDIVILDGNNYIDEHQPIWSNQGVLSGPAQLKATSTNVINDGSISIAGRYSAAYPLWDVSTRILVSKGLCQLMYEPDPITGLVTDTELHPCIDPWLSAANIVEAPTAYGIWIYDMGNNTELPIVISEPGKIITDVVALLSRSEPPIIFDKGVGDINAVWSSEGVGVLNIRSVYDFGNASFNGCFLDDCTNATVTSVQELGDPALAIADQRPARFIRIVKAVGIPDPDDPDLANPPDVANTAFGPSRQLGMREIIGYAPVEPDGSVKVKVPFNVAFSLDVLDKDGRRIGPRHDNWLQVRPGDTLNCTGCHTHDNNQAAALLPHGRDDAMATSINSGAPYDGYIFPNTLNDITMGPYFADYSDTMAEARTRQVPAALTPTVNIVYDDAWTDPVVRPRDLSYSFDYTGVNGLTTLSPASGACEVSWTHHKLKIRGSEGLLYHRKNGYSLIHI